MVSTISSLLCHLAGEHVLLSSSLGKGLASACLLLPSTSSCIVVCLLSVLLVKTFCQKFPDNTIHKVIRKAGKIIGRKPGEVLSKIKEILVVGEG